MSKPLFVFAGGGTGGHLFPGIAVAESLKALRPDSQFLFVGSGRAVEQSILREASYETRTLNVPPIATALRHPLRFVQGHVADWSTVRHLIENDKPAAVIGLGGLASFVLANAAIGRCIPVVLLEQNVIPGRANRCLSRRAVVCSSFEDTAKHLPRAQRIVLTGNPLRPEIAQAEVPSPDEIASRNTLLILGGSQGSRQVNEAVLKSARQLATGSAAGSLGNWQVIHQTGLADVEAYRQEWQRLGIDATVEPFFNDLPKQYLQASLVISRAGATTLAELACLNLPSILIPFEHARDDHQTANANVFQAAGAARIVDPRTPDFEDLIAQSLTDLIANPRLRESMSSNCEALARRDASAKVASIVLP